MKYFWILMFCMVLLSKGAFTQEDEDDDVDSVVEDIDSSEPEAEEINVPKEKRPVYKPPKAKGNAYLSEPFLTEENFKKRWVVSKAKKDGTDEAISKYDGVWKVEEPENNPLQNDLGLVLKSKAKHHAVSTKLDKPFKFDGKPLIVQYEVKFQNGQECGGAYVKLLTHDSKQDLKMFYDKTPFTIMFGPDRCGNDDKLHFIFRHKHPVTGEFEEKHAKKPTASLGSYFTDKKTHLYRLVVNPDNSFVVSVDTDEVNSGSLLKDVEPPVNPAKEIVDPDDKKPEDWDEREKIADPEATKPEDWDETAPEFITDPDATKPEGWLDNEPELIPDPDSEKPADWDEDMDGEWEPAQISNPACESAPGCGTWSPPEIKNPAYKGKWKAPKIDNPNYKGKWKPRMIPNPNFFEDNDPYMMTSISAVGLELWSMSDGILFDNFLITDDMSVANRWTEDSFKVKTQQELIRSDGKSVVQAVMDMTNEYPWLWAIIIIVVILPIVLLFAYCCTGSSNKASSEAERKKTDAPSPDVKESEDDDDEEESEDKEAQGSQEEESENNAVDSSGDAKQVNKTEPKKKSKSDLNEEALEADAEEDEENESSTPSKSTPRKRKTRARKD